jgi:hypothetical protein
MTFNILHLRGTEYSEGRYNSFMKELAEQNITDFKIWDGIYDGANRRRGINKAHKQIVADAKRNGLSEVCICEDDIVFLGKGAFDYFIQNKPAEYDLYLGGLSNLVRRKDDYITDFRGFTLYIVHESFYDRYLSTKDDVDIDGAMKDLGKYYLCQKVVCTQKAGWSYHRKKVVDYSRLLNQYDLYKNE